MRFRTSLLVALALCLVLPGCTSDSEPRTPPAATGTTPVRIELVRSGPAESVSAGRATHPLDDGTIASAMSVVQRWFEATSVDPLVKGRAGSIDQLFTPDAVRQAATVDREAMYDEGLPRVSRLAADPHTVQVSGFSDEADHPVLLIAKFSWGLRGDGDRVRVTRSGELTLTPVFGNWMVSAYEVSAARTVNGATTTTAVKK